MTILELTNLELERLHKLAAACSTLDTESRAVAMIEAYCRALTTTGITMEDKK